MMYEIIAAYQSATLHIQTARAQMNYPEAEPSGYQNKRS